MLSNNSSRVIFLFGFLENSSSRVISSVGFFANSSSRVIVFSVSVFSEASCD